MFLNYPENIAPPLVCGKMVLHETSPWCQKVGDCNPKKVETELPYHPAILLPGIFPE